MGQLHSLFGAEFTDTTMPILFDDQRLTDGSLALLDTSHSFTGLTSVPAHGDHVDNIARSTAAPLMGVEESAVDGFEWFNTFDESRGLFELTSKHAMHGMVVNADQNGERAYFRTPQTVVDYITANPNRHYAIFIWADVTRLTASSANFFDSIAYFNAASTSGNNMGLLQLANTLGRQRKSEERPTGMSGAPNSNTGLNWGIPFAWGNAAPYDSLQSDVGRSVVLYGWHLIDVTASGMTYAELDARDAKLYAEAFAEGGRYHGDSYSDPDVVLP